MLPTTPHCTDWGGSCKWSLPVVETDFRICLCFNRASERNILKRLWCVLAQQPQANTAVGPHWQWGLFLLAQLEEQSGWPYKDMGVHKKSVHMHTQGTSNPFRFACTCIFFELWKRGSPQFWLSCEYISPSAVMLLKMSAVEIIFSKHFYCLPVPLSPSAWEMCKALPSWWAQLERAARTKSKIYTLGCLWPFLSLLKTLCWQIQGMFFFSRTLGGISSHFQ